MREIADHRQAVSLKGIVMGWIHLRIPPDFNPMLFPAMYREQVEEARNLRPLEYGSHLIQNQYRNPITVEGVAGRCGMSREHFMRTYKREYGRAPGEVLRELRLGNAAFMLRSTVKSVESIAHASGFSSSNACCRAFRKHFGFSPGQYRSKHSGMDALLG